MTRQILVTLAMLLASVPAWARDVAGVNVPETITSGDRPLVLNGAGIRSKFFIKVYVGALYLPARRRDAEALVRQTGPVAMHLHFLHSEVSREKLVNAWNEGFDANLNPGERARLAARIGQFNALFRTVRRGDVVRLDYQPGRGTRVTINEDTRGTLDGEDFMQAWLRIWLGTHPADADLKQGLLGAD